MTTAHCEPNSITLPMVTSTSSTSLTMTWSAPLTGDSLITDYDVQYRRSGNVVSPVDQEVGRW